MTGTAERQTTALSTRQIAGLRSRLASDREQTLSEMARITEEMSAFVIARRDAPTDDEHDPEGPTLAFERSQSSALLGQARQHLADVDAALTRIAEGHYGTCTNCRREIAPARLDARPQAALCITCAAKVR